MAPKSAKAATAPAAAEPAEFAIDVGTKVQFLGYAADVPAEDRVIEDGTVVEISGFGEEGEIFALIDNPDFNAKKKEHPETNPKQVEVQVMDTEIGPVAEEAEPEPAPAPTTRGKATTKAAAKAEAEAPAAVAQKSKGKAATTKAAAAAPAAGKGKGKATTKTATKAADKAAAAAAAAEELDPNELPDLDVEDATVAALVTENEGNLIAVAQELEAAAATSEYQLGGVLFHIKKSGEYKEIDKGAYAGEKGWQEFVEAYFNVKYRKAQYLIEIYTAFSLKGYENAAELVAGMGWSKAAKIARPMLDGYDADDLIEAANNNTIEDLSSVIKETTSEGGTKGTAGNKVVKLTVKFRLEQEDATSAETILAAAQEQMGLKDVGEAFMSILVDWYNNNVAAAEVAAETAKQSAAPARKAAGKRAVTA